MIVRKANRLPPATKYIVQKFIPFPAVALASTSNVLLMRWHERSAGIKVYDSNNNVVGTSQIAAKKVLTYDDDFFLFIIKWSFLSGT